MMIKELINWIKVFRHGRAFRNYTDADMAMQLDRCVKNETVLVVNNKEGAVVGIVCWSERKNKTIFIEDILAIENGVLRTMMDVFMVRYPGWSICGTTKSGFKKFNPQKLLNLSPKYINL